MRDNQNSHNLCIYRNNFVIVDKEICYILAIKAFNNGEKMTEMKKES